VPDIEQIAGRTAAGISLAYRSGEASPVEVVEFLLGKIAASKLENIFIAVTADRAMEEARAADRRYKSGTPLSALDGVPIGWKDLVDIAGTRTTAGSKVLSARPAKNADAPIAANAAKAGMVTMGKLNMTELAYSALGLNPHFGTPANPNGKAPRRAPGGSSSGSAVAVAARLLPCAIGSDTGGSVRIPSSFNGVVGYKTSPGRIDTTGVVPLASTYDTIGPIARSVEDCILLDRALRGAISAESLRADLHDVEIVVPTNVVLEGVQEAVLSNFECSMAALAAAGVTIRRERVDILDRMLEMNAKYGTLTAAEAYHEFHDLVDGEQAKEIDRRVVKRILDGKRMSANDLISIQRGRRQLITELTSHLRGALMAWPTTAITAPEIVELEKDDETFHRINLLTLRNTMPGNILDLCGVALPNGHDANGMPTSTLISATADDDERLLGVAIEVERVLAGVRD
jgi:aspartyl-tRNA(Asn)/glutamyl-tRNA(Gln) amidotransferase subunit A